MRLTTGFRYELPFELWTGTIDAITDAMVYTKSGDRLGMVVQAGGGLNLVTEEALPLYAQVRDLVDTKGVPIFVNSGEPYNMYVTTSDPQFDPWMRIIGWRHRLNRELPRDYVAALDAILEP